MIIQGFSSLYVALNCKLKEFSLFFALVAATAVAGILLIHSKNMTSTNDCRVSNVISLAAGSTLANFPSRPQEVFDSPCTPNVKKGLFEYTVPPHPKVNYSEKLNMGEGLFYYYVPVVAKALGLFRPLLALALFSAFLSWIVCIFCFHIAIQNNFLLLLIAYFGCSYFYLTDFSGLVSVYYQHLLMPPTLAAIGWLSLQFVGQDKFSWNLKGNSMKNLAGIVLLSTIAGFSILLRTSVIVPFYVGILAILFLCWFFRDQKKKKLWRVIAILGVILCTSFAVRTSFRPSMIKTGSAGNTQDEPETHLFWHTLWCSLGLLNDKRYPFQWWDGSPEVYAKSIDPNVEIYGNRYEIFLRRYIIYVLRTDPGFFWKFLKFQIEQDVLPFLFGMFTFFVVLLGRQWLNIGSIVFSFLLLAGTLGTRPLQLISAKLDFYYYQVWVGELFSRFVFAYVLALGAMAILSRLKDRKTVLSIGS